MAIHTLNNDTKFIHEKNYFALHRKGFYMSKRDTNANLRNGYNNAKSTSGWWARVSEPGLYELRYSFQPKDVANGAYHIYVEGFDYTGRNEMHNRYGDAIYQAHFSTTGSNGEGSAQSHVLLVECRVEGTEANQGLTMGITSTSTNVCAWGSLEMIKVGELGD